MCLAQGPQHSDTIKKFKNNLDPNQATMVILPDTMYTFRNTQGKGGGAQGGGGGTLIFSHIRRLGPFFGVQNSEFQYFFGFSEK